MSESSLWPKDVLADPHRSAEKSRRVRATFDRIAAGYERANRVISFGLDDWAKWRLGRRAERAWPIGTEKGGRIVDVCAGPGGFARRLARRFPRAEVVAVDFSGPMLAAGARRGGPSNLAWAGGDALALPLADGACDLVTCVYGLRNLADLDRGLAEIVRVLRPGGALLALDFQMPRNRRFGPIFRTYFEHVMPRLGEWAAGCPGSGAYAYLAASVRNWHDGDFLLESLGRAGLRAPWLEHWAAGTMVAFGGTKSDG